METIVMGSMGREAVKVMNDEQIQTILEDWANKWGTDYMPRFCVWGSETYEMYKERLIQEYNKRINELYYIEHIYRIFS